ncbi:hypothetical protein BCR41DRAFT_138645 [Lobosporangium transversale]|uniref:RNA-directed RNA polymerase C-terminal domain-containing protein n=1 Tax=Lobosporangium transversale TaxID=64571 RepID=A0A1Y2GFJ1_9FUNG|nr:hypothetical protein BCR41DRAFT_138645 [Lobosporangium transversale]ORZ09399.1 hypothetical protein BCR41DRAFT_138645 [Lobosporangium transversale]|eukprot:XP_021878852.1 hypothetical protein BCR41DRAFT_138645 [Lobosporangium transversale]
MIGTGYTSPSSNQRRYPTVTNFQQPQAQTGTGHVALSTQVIGTDNSLSTRIRSFDASSAPPIVDYGVTSAPRYSFATNIDATTTDNNNVNGHDNRNRYANPISRATIISGWADHNQRLIALGVDQLEQRLSIISDSSLRQLPNPPHKFTEGFRLFDINELRRIKRQLEVEYHHFTHHHNKKFYKQMDNIIEHAPRDPLVEVFSKIRPPPLPAELDLDQCAYIKTCSRIQMNHLKLFNRQPRVMPAKFEKAFRRAVEHVKALMALPEKLSMPTVESLKDVRYDGSKFAGLEYARDKLYKRREAHTYALRHAEEVWTSLMDGNLVHPHDTRLGGKGKQVEMDKDMHGKIKDPDAESWLFSSGSRNLDSLESINTSMGRLILMLSHRDLLILGSLEQPLTKAYLDDKWPIYIGQSWYYGGAEKFVNKMSRHAIYHCFDAKKFDAAIDGWLVQEALQVLRAQYEDGMNPKYDTLWTFVYKSLVEVIICRDDGIRLQKHVGTTSGNCFNTLVQSIITMFLGYTALIYEAEKRQGSIGVYLILTQCEMVMALETPWMGLTKEILADVVKECFNIDWSGKKSFSTNRLMDDSAMDYKKFQGVQFLGMYFRHQRLGNSPFAPKVVIPYRPFRESYLSLLFPKHGGYTREESWLRALGIYLNAAGNQETQEWLEAYLDFLELVPFVRPTAWPPSMERWVNKDYWNHDTKPPPPKRITIQEWYRLACEPRDVDD